MIKYTTGYKYQLKERAYFYLPTIFKMFEFRSDFMELKNGVLVFQAGYAWDGASGPTYDSKNSMQGSLVHDGLYQAMREGLLPRTLKPDTDQLLYDICVNDGMNRFRAWIWLKAVNQFGLYGTIQNKDIKVAP